MSAKNVLSLGQCGADHYRLSQLVERSLGARLVAVDSAEEALAALREQSVALVLVNRVLDADGTSGLDFISRMRQDPAFQAVPVMLVSNYEDAQQQAVSLGAVPGFGKAAVGSPATLHRLKPYLE